MRLGVFGGTFDPPHVGHLIVASDAYDALDLDRILFIPSAQPPHKSGVHATPEQRLALTRAAVADDDRFEVDAVELQRTGASYTADTLRILRDRYPDAEIFLLVGADAAREMHSWHRPDAVADLARIAVMSREGDDEDLGETAIPVRVTRIDLSSTDLRERVRDGRSIRYLVPEVIRGDVEEIYGASTRAAVDDVLRLSQTSDARRGGQVSSRDDLHERG
ncbi:MAG TPA: nicotinate-nucleotide adenylyltransferase [Longimicrobiaceae bacterium]|nr:nicotinate-nucleotide adenylyltransferase [Longimicrobiaceae bacterium]